MSKKRWQKEVLAPYLAKGEERKGTFKNTSFAIESLYGPADIGDIKYEQDIGYPGEYPFTRGIHPTMYRGRLWTMRQYAGFGSAEESNQRYRYLLNQGQTGLSVAFDLPTQIGYDSTDPLSEGEVGKVGVAIDSLKDMEILLAGIPLDQVSVSMTINATAPIILAMYLAVAEKQGVSFDQLTGTIQNDILKEYIARGTYIYPPPQSLRLITNIFSYCQAEVPKWNTISISGYHIREAGATAVQELAFTFANALVYVEAALTAGLAIDQFAPRLSFFFAAHNNLLEEVAKFRAARKIWARLIRDKFGGSGKSQLMRFHTQTGGVTLTAQQAHNNIARVTLQALAAVLGGTQSLHTNSMDEAMALPSEEAVRVALRTQQILAFESGVADVVDPLAGSYYIENLTKKIEDEVLDYLAKIDAMGGMLKAIQEGYIQREIQNSSYSYQLEVEQKEQIIVGVNEFQDKEEDIRIKLHMANKQSEDTQKKQLQDLKKTRDAEQVRKSLDKVTQAARNGDNLMPPILEAVKRYATLQEIADELRTVFGQYKEQIIL